MTYYNRDFLSSRDIDQLKKTLPVSFPVEIVIITTELARGGAEKNILQLTRGLPADEFNPHVIGLKPPGNLTEDLDAAGVSWETLDIKRTDSTPVHPEHFFQLVHRIADRNPPLVLTYLFHANLIGRFAARLASVPIVLSSIRTAERGDTLRPLLDGFTHMLVDQTICISRGVMEYTERKAGISEQKILTIPNAIDHSAKESPSLERDQLFARRDATDGDPLILSAGRLVEQKGFDIYLPALKKLTEDFPGLRAIIFGEGEHREKLEQQVRDLNLEEHVFLPGWTDHLEDWMHIADLFVLSSRWEGMANVIMEAGAIGLPFVATDVSGVREIIPRDLRDAHFLIEPGSTEPLTEAVRKSLDNPERSRRQAERIKTFIRNHFTLSKLIDRHRNLYFQKLTEYFGTSL